MATRKISSGGLIQRERWRSSRQYRGRVDEGRVHPLSWFLLLARRIVVVLSLAQTDFDAPGLMTSHIIAYLSPYVL